MADKMVRVKDPASGEIVIIPFSQIPPGMIRTYDAACGAEIWQKPGELEAGELRHPPFPPDTMALIEEVRQTFEDVYPQTLAEWEQGFRRDMNPHKEIGLWLFMGELYCRFTTGRPLDADQKTDIFRTILTAVNNGTKYVLATECPRTLSKKRIRGIVDFIKTSGKDACGRAWARTGAPLFRQAGGTITLSIHSMFAADGLSHNIYCDSRPFLAAAEIIFSVDVMSQKKTVVYGREALALIGEGPSPRVLCVELDEDTDELERLCALVQVTKGRHECQGRAGN
jgi:hypothetical protein